MRRGQQVQGVTPQEERRDPSKAKESKQWLRCLSAKLVLSTWMSVPLGGSRRAVRIMTSGIVVVSMLLLLLVWMFFRRSTSLHQCWAFRPDNWAGEEAVVCPGGVEFPSSPEATTVDHTHDGIAECNNRAAAGAGDSVAIILSFPRSGSHMVRAAVEFLAQRPTVGSTVFNSGVHRFQENPLDPPIHSRPRVNSSVFGVNTSTHTTPAGFKVHSIRKGMFHSAVVKDWILVLVLRDPFEAIHSELKDTVWVYRYLADKDEAALAHLVENTRAVLAFPGRKHIMYYEDLLDSAVVGATSRRGAALRSLGRALGVPCERSLEAADRAEEIFAEALRALNRTPASQGDSHYYSQLLTGQKFHRHASITVPEDVWTLFERYPHVKRADCGQADVRRCSYYEWRRAVDLGT